MFAHFVVYYIGLKIVRLCTTAGLFIEARKWINLIDSNQTCDLHWSFAFFRTGLVCSVCYKTLDQT